MRTDVRMEDGQRRVILRQPRLIATCRQIRKEALAAFYAANKFKHKINVSDVSTDLLSLTSYLEAIGKENCGNLCRVRIDFAFERQTSWKVS